MDWLLVLFQLLGMMLSLAAAEFGGHARDMLLAALAGGWFVLVLPYAHRPRAYTLRVFGGAALLAATAAGYIGLRSLTDSWALEVLLGLPAAGMLALVIMRVIPRPDSTEHR